jgi:malate dehydrogenase
MIRDKFDIAGFSWLTSGLDLLPLQAYAAARFAESCMRALDGDPDVYECAYVQSEVTELPFFANRVKLGKKGLEAVVSGDLAGLTEYEQKALEALKPELKASIEKGISFANKQPTAAV